VSRDVLQSQADSIRQLNSRAKKKALALTKEKLRDIRRELDGMELGSWNANTKTATMVQLQAAVSQLSKGQTNLLREGLGTTARVSAGDAARSLTELDKSYLGASSPLRFDTTDWISNQSRYRSVTRLREFSQSFARYGAATVATVERELAKSVMVGEPWTAARKKVWSATRNVVGHNQWMVDRILRTETSAAYNGTMLAALEESDEPQDPMMKRLVATFDWRTGKDSVMLHGQTRPVKEPFTDPWFGRDYMAPPNRPNDREIIVPWRASYGQDFVGGDEGYISDTASTGALDGKPDFIGARSAEAEKIFNDLQKGPRKKQTLVSTRRKVIRGEISNLDRQMREVDGGLKSLGDVGGFDRKILDERMAHLVSAQTALRKEWNDLSTLAATIAIASGTKAPPQAPPLPPVPRTPPKGSGGDSLAEQSREIKKRYRQILKLPPNETMAIRSKLERELDRVDGRSKATKFQNQEWDLRNKKRDSTDRVVWVRTKDFDRLLDAGDIAGGPNGPKLDTTKMSKLKKSLKGKNRYARTPPRATLKGAKGLALVSGGAYHYAEASGAGAGWVPIVVEGSEVDDFVALLPRESVKRGKTPPTLTPPLNSPPSRG